MGNMEPTVNETNDEYERHDINIDFTDTEIAFSIKKDKELKRMSLLFKAMNNPTLVKIGSNLAILALKLRLPLTEWAIKNTIFHQFVGGDSLLHCQRTVDKLYSFDTLTVLDYGAEAKSKEEDLDEVMEENLRAIEFAASNTSVPIITIKMTGLSQNHILEKLCSGKKLTGSEEVLYDRLMTRLEEICDKAHELSVGVFIDAEESWIQKAIDDISLGLMADYNKEKVTVYTTYQMYMKGKLAQMIRDHKAATEGEFMLGAKIVRGAYMEKENARAKAKGYLSPVQDSKQDTDSDFNSAIDYCIDNYETVSFCNATHNLISTKLMVDKLIDKGLDISHPHLNFSQLYGMSDNITFNLANAGFNVAKYVPYGPVKDVIPYLVRRAQENSSITGEASRELNLVNQEMNRRGL
jgi:proline dehydrogenase